MAATDDAREIPSFARANMPDHVELRVFVPRNVVNVIDAEVFNRGGEGANVYRATIVHEVLAPWAEKKIKEATVVVKLAGVIPTGSQEDRRG